MAKYTTNYNLFLPEPNDEIDVTVDLSNNFTAIDLQLAALSGIAVGGATISPQLLVDWTESDSYEPVTITYDVTYTTVPKTIIVKWPDGSAGTLTVDTINPSFYLIDAYHVTHVLSGKTVTQNLVTRNGVGLITSKPALVVS